MKTHPENHWLLAKYAITAKLYDILDYPWERIYRQWRPSLLQDIHGKVLEAGVGTGHNLVHYPEDCIVTGIDLSPAMLNKAQKRASQARANVKLIQQDAVHMSKIPNDYYDWLLSTFMCCVMPDIVQPKAISEFARVLKPGGKFRLLEIVYSKDPALRKRQQRLAKFVYKVYGARFDHETLRFLEENPHLEITTTRFLRSDTYLLIEGKRIK